MSGSSLFNHQGQRLFFTKEERDAFIAAADRAAAKTRTFCSLLHFTGCNISEAMDLTPQHIDLSGTAILFQGITPGRHNVHRAVPVPDTFINLLDEIYDIRQTLGSERSKEPLWPVGRVTVWKHVSRVIAAAGIHDGPHALPKGIRHGFIVHAIRQRVFLPRLQHWVGHALPETTMQYATDLQLYAPELLADDRSEAARLW